MKLFRVLLVVACLCFLSQGANAETFSINPGDLKVIEAGNMEIEVYNFKSKHTVTVIDKKTKEMKMSLDFLFPGFKSEMSFDEFNGKKISISCERNIIKLEVN